MGFSPRKERDQPGGARASMMKAEIKSKIKEESKKKNFGNLE